MLDLLITHATLADGRTHMSVAVQDGKITEVTEGLQAPAHETVDAQDLLLSTPFVDPHFHMDATLSYGMPRVNESGTLLEGIALVVFASWKPGKALLGALLFAFFDALQLRLQQSGEGLLPYQFYLMLPYLLSILALVLVARKAAYPQALMKPYRKGER